MPPPLSFSIERPPACASWWHPCQQRGGRNRGQPRERQGRPSGPHGGRSRTRGERHAACRRGCTTTTAAGPPAARGPPRPVRPVVGRGGPTAASCRTTRRASMPADCRSAVVERGRVAPPPGSGVLLRRFLAGGQRNARLLHSSLKAVADARPCGPGGFRPCRLPPRCFFPPSIPPPKLPIPSCHFSPPFFRTSLPS